MADQSLRSTWDAASMKGLQPAVDAALLAAEPEPELEALVALVTDTREPFADGMSTPEKKDGVPPPIGDPGAMVRTGSNRSNRSGGRTSASSPGAEDLERRYSDVDSELEALRKTQHIVESEVFAADLTATWHDQQAGITDWRSCLISGSHLKTKEEKQDGGRAMADAGARGEVLRAVWKSSIQVAIKKNLNSLIENEDEVKLFLELHHPHVVACYGILTEPDKYGESMKSIVTERCNTSLEAFLGDHDNWKEKKPETIDMMKYTIVQHVTLGLQKLHDMNVLHRDIKANNILLDGAAGECSECHHSGKWKICDFGEAKVLKTPSLAFGKPQDWPRGWSHSLITAKRFQKITSPFLRAQGARWYCWLLPGEKLTPEADHAIPEGATEGATEWAPCNHGGFVYSFSDDPAMPSTYDRYFDIEGTHDKPLQSSGKIFPDTLGPFGLVSTELLPELNLKESTFELRKKIHQNEELEKLKGFLTEGKTIQGTLSPVAELTLPPSAKRTAMIPEESTHFVWAYQGVDLEELTQEQSSQLEITSGEISFVSLGGFVYLKQVDDDDDGNASYKVVKANAISLENGKTCRTGTVRRQTCGQVTCDPLNHHFCSDGVTACDNGVTAAVASPELIDGLGIGLETDIYAFGIVMWEVFTRREAWHWIKGGPEKNQAIIVQAGVHGRRPKMPDSLSPDCAKWVRKCLHADPGRRPTAKEIGGWITGCREEVGERMKVSANEVVRGRDVHETAEKTARTRWPNKAIHNHNDDHWSRRGRFTLHTSQLTGGANPGFSLNVVECSQDQWMEHALVGNEKKSRPLAKLAKLPTDKFGLVFSRNNGHGGKLQLWPQVTERSFSNTIADEFPSITVGSKITKINGQPVPATFNLALPMLKSRPLALEFTSAVAESTDVVQRWIQAGLLEIGLVRRHETKKLIKHREEHDPTCGNPHCKSDHGDAVRGSSCVEHQGTCPLGRTSSGWMTLARMDSKPQAEPVVTVTQSFAKKAAASHVKWAAMDAARDAVAMLRAWEERPDTPEGVPPAKGP